MLSISEAMETRNLLTGRVGPLHRKCRASDNCCTRSLLELVLFRIADTIVAVTFALVQLLHDTIVSLIFSVIWVAIVYPLSRLRRALL